MPRKLFQKYLPSAHSVQNYRVLGPFRSFLVHPNLWHLNRRSVAGGVAVGAFTGLLLGPIQMLFAAIFALVFRVNLPVAVATTWYTNPVTALPLYYAAYRIGAWLSGDPAMASLPPFRWNDVSIVEFFPAFVNWVQALGKPFAIGLLALALLLSALSYIAVRAGWRVYIVMQWRRRKRLRAARELP